MKIFPALGLMALVIGARGVGYEEGHKDYEKAHAIAMDNKRTGELALKALDKAWLSCATPFNQFKQDDDQPREIDFRR